MDDQVPERSFHVGRRSAVVDLSVPGPGRGLRRQRLTARRGLAVSEGAPPILGESPWRGRGRRHAPSRKSGHSFHLEPLLLTTLRLLLAPSRLKAAFSGVLETPCTCYERCDDGTDLVAGKLFRGRRRANGSHDRRSVEIVRRRCFAVLVGCPGRAFVRRVPRRPDVRWQPADVGIIVVDHGFALNALEAPWRRRGCRLGLPDSQGSADIIRSHVHVEPVDKRSCHANNRAACWIRGRLTVRVERYPQFDKRLGGRAVATGGASRGPRKGSPN